MTLLDDASLALIARFVVDDIDHLSVSDEEFLQHQLIEIKNLVKELPAEKRQQVIMSWISEHAEQYRSEWQKKAYSQLLLKRRCSDCPLINDDSKFNCTIHSKWTSLLEDYIAGKIESEEYVEVTLELLEKHKDKLKISRILSAL